MSQISIVMSASHNGEHSHVVPKILMCKAYMPGIMVLRHFSKSYSHEAAACHGG